MNKIISTLDILLKYLAPDQIGVQGGEPFMYKDLPVFIYYVTQVKKMKLNIATNGTILPKFNHSILANDLITVRISNYSTLHKTRSNLVVDMCEKNNVKYISYSFASGKDMWFDLGGIDRPKDDNNAVVLERLKQCKFNICLTLENGKLAYCSRGVIAEEVQKFVPTEDESCLQVTDSADFQARLYNFVNNKRIIAACRYCNGTGPDTPLIEPAIQI